MNFRSKGLPINSGFLDQIGVVGPTGGLHHLLKQLLGQLGQGRAQLGGGLWAELSLAFKELGNVDVGQTRLGCYLTVRLARVALRRLQ